MRFQDGDNKFRVLDGPLLGWEAWTLDKKPVRWAYDNQPMTQDLIDANCYDPKSKEGQSEKHFWAFKVWNYQDKEVQVLSITQASIQRALTDLINSDDWGPLEEYDVVVKRTGKSLETRYSVQATPPKELPQDAKDFDKKCNLEALLTNEDPFDDKSVGQDIVKDIDPDDIPF